MKKGFKSVSYTHLVYPLRHNSDLCLEQLIYADKACNNNKHLCSLFQLDVYKRQHMMIPIFSPFMLESAEAPVFATAVTV